MKNYSRNLMERMDGASTENASRKTHLTWQDWRLCTTQFEMRKPQRGKTQHPQKHGRRPRHKFPRPTVREEEGEGKAEADRGGDHSLARTTGGLSCQRCQMAKFDPLLSLDCAEWRAGRAIQGKERIKFCSAAKHTIHL